MLISVSHESLPRTGSVRASVVMDHFGIRFEQGRHTIVENLDLPIESGQIVLFIGASSSGKSSLMRAVAAKLTSDGQAVVNIDQLTLPQMMLIDAVPGEPPEAMRLLAQCGLGEARLLLGTPTELSDGQRYRFRLALGLAMKPDWLVADEFTATLDRTLAKVLAFSLRRQAYRTGTGFLLATTHEDIVDDLSPDVHVRCRLDGEIDVASRECEPPVHVIQELDDARPVSLSASSRRPLAEGREKKESASPRTCGSPLRPVATGRTSLGGIIGPISSG